MTIERTRAPQPSTILSTPRRPKSHRRGCYTALALVTAALLGACGAAQESGEEEAETGVASETESVRVAEVVTETQEEIAMESADLEIVMDHGGLPVVDDKSLTNLDIPTEEEMSCGCSSHPNELACLEFCLCLAEGGDPAVCVVEFIDKMTGKRPG